AADHRHRVTYQQIDALTRQLARKLGLDVAAPARPVDEHWVSVVADDLKANRGNALVVPGDQQPPAVHAIAQAINHHIGAYNRGVAAIEPVDYSHRAQPLESLAAAMHADAVEALVVVGGNPVYTAPVDLDFGRAYTRLPWTLHWGERDETARHSLWHVPAAHPMETWGDARAYQGTVTLIQPLLRPMNGGRTALQMLAALAEGIDHDPAELLVDYWRERHRGGDFGSFWRRSLHDGMVPGTESLPVKVEPRPGWQQRLAQPAAGEPELVLQLRPDPAIWDGRYANNGWLQELPRPLTKMTWGNVLLVSPVLAEARDLTNGEVMRVAAGEHYLDVPVYVLPGQPEGAVSLHLGYGRSTAGRVAEGIGRNAYELRSSTTPWAVPVTLTKRDFVERLPITQQHQAIMGRDLVRVADLAHYRKDPLFAHKPEPDVSLYPEPWPAPRKAKHEWGMAVDLSACIGCNACVVACQAENNIPIVGPEEVARGHEMHWLRIDRYFDGPLDGPRLVFQPVPCMHCENAPCEYVCPVGATQHTASGLNMMVYQRCIGTRDCSQNCPYKVRRFNWFDYAGPDTEYPEPKAVQNPSVTVRYRGVMEKCTYCVQRIQAAEIAAESEDRPIRDAELKTACQQACPTKAIVFGDIAEEASEVHALKQHPLNYAMLGELNTRPRTTYLAAVRNPNPALQKPDHASPEDEDYPGSEVDAWDWENGGARK
ncbi:MAG: 4Fe-4S dicluster domain-containing protein, partial [Nitrococcus sp.]|nr:4Fe-4S dicluster domain-containing protein [Nitrococcus sp.]